MTLAICIRCGSEKLGALTSCSQCQFAPESPEDQARSILLTDHFLDRDALMTASTELKAGKTIHFNETDVAEWTEHIRANPNELKMPIGCAIVWYSPIAIMILLVIVMGVLVIYLARN